MQCTYDRMYKPMETSEDTPTPVLANPTLQRSDETEHSSRAKSKSEFCGSGDNLARKLARNFDSGNLQLSRPFSRRLSRMELPVFLSFRAEALVHPYLALTESTSSLRGKEQIHVAMGKHSSFSFTRSAIRNSDSDSENFNATSPTIIQFC